MGGGTCHELQFLGFPAEAPGGQGLRRVLGDFCAALICLGAVLAEQQFSFTNRYATVLLSAIGLFGITFALRLYAGNFLAAVICTGAVFIDYSLHGWQWKMSR